MTEAPTTPLLRNRNFLWFWGGDSISQLGSQFTLLAIPVLAVTLLQATEWEVGLLNAAQTAAFLVVGLPAGAWVDRWLKRRVMIAADLVRVVALALIPLLWFSNVLEIWHLIIIATVIGVATVFFDVSYQSYVPILLPGVHVGNANSKLETTNSIARIGGPGLAGALLAVVSAPVLLLIDSFSYLVSAVCIWRVRDDEQPSDPAERQGLAKEIGEGLRFVFGHPLIRRIVGTTAGTNFFATLAMTLEAIFILRTLDFAPAVLGVIFAFGATGGLIGAVTTPWVTKLIGEGTALSVSAVAFGIGVFAFPLASLFPAAALPILIVGAFVESYFVLVYNITQVTMRQRLCPPRLLGRMNASIRFVVWGVMPIASLLAGLLGSTLGVVPTLWIGFVGTVLASLFVVLSPLTTMKTLPSDQLPDARSPRASEESGA